MSITLTELAANKIKEIIKEQSLPETAKPSCALPSKAADAAGSATCST